MRPFALILAACAASTFSSPGLANSAPVKAAAAGEMRMPHVSVTSSGSGDPIVLVPGLSTPRAVWDGVVPALAKRHRVILVQVNGFAGDGAGANLQPGILDGIVDDLHRYIRSARLGPVRLVGHSMGGLVGLMLAKSHPEDVRALMIVDALPYVGDIFVPGAAVAQLEPQAKAMRDQMLASYGKADAAAAQRTAASMAVTPAAQSKVAAWIAAADPRVSGQAMYEDLTTDLRPDMAAIRTPITLVYPWSAAMPKDRADAFYRTEYTKASSVTFVPIADSGHFVMLDQPELFAAAIDAFAK